MVRIAGLVLMTALRRMALQRTELAKATAGTIRLKLLKLGALVTVSVRRVKIAIAVRQPHEERIRVCSPATMFRRLKRLVSIPKYIAEGANTPALEDPAHKPRLLKRPDSSQWSPHETPFTDRSAGEICGLAWISHER